MNTVLQNKPYGGLVAYGAAFYALKHVLNAVRWDAAASRIGTAFAMAPAPVAMALMALPEQGVLAAMEPRMPLYRRVLVSVAMYVIHFAYNGMVMKPLKSYDELAWIIGTAAYAYTVIGVRWDTAVALVAADAVMTLALRGMV